MKTAILLVLVGCVFGGFTTAFGSTNTFLGLFRYDVQFVGSEARGNWIRQENDEAYYRDPFVAAETVIREATNGETWEAVLTKADGTVIRWDPVQFYDNYDGRSNCFVSPVWTECGRTVQWIQWYARSQCQAPGTWRWEFLNNGQIFHAAQFAVLPQIPPGRVPLYNQADYADPSNPDHAYDNICRTGTQRNVYVCDGRPNEVRWTIRGKGCYLTDAAMILSYHGVGVDPMTLNTWLSENRGYRPGGDIRPRAIVQYAMSNGGNITFPAETPNSQSVWNGLAEPERFICTYGPRMLGVNASPTTSQPRHWVVAIGRNADRSTYLINDPAGGVETTLAGGYENRYTAMRTFGRPSATYTDSTGISISFHSPGDLLLTDPQGRRVGYNPVQGLTYAEIPGAFYESHYLADDESGDPGPLTKELDVPWPVPGKYNLEVFGTGEGVYTLDISAYDPKMNPSIRQFWDVSISPGTVHTYAFQYAKQVGVELEFDAVSGNFDGKGQRPADVNKFLSYVAPMEGTVTLPAGTAKYSVVIIYDRAVIPGTFKAEFNGRDVSASFKPAPAGIESVRLDLERGRNVLVLSIEGRIGDRVARDTDRLVFVVP
ncbi:MAG: hypothetical protein HY039_06665 [Nitrospirae bacterium]|nr:hypothetical protein [Nitrospirota bacterium]